MKKVLFVLLFIVGVGTAHAQKKGNDRETSIEVNYPIISIVLDDGKDAQGNDLGFAIIQMHDRKLQLIDLDYHILDAQARRNDPPSPYAKVIFMEDLGGYNFRLTENMEERSREPDGINVLLIHKSKFLPAIRQKYPNSQ